MSLADDIRERMTAAGIAADDPGLAKLLAWNTTVLRTAGVPLPDPEPIPPTNREGREEVGKTDCRREGCDAEIEWALPDDPGRDSKMPVDYWSAGDKRGTLALHRDAAGDLRYRVLTKAHPDLRRGELRGVSHWVTCKNPPPRKPKGVAAAGGVPDGTA